MELKKEMNKFELDLLMADYKERINKAETEGNQELANKLLKESFAKAKELGWKPFGH